MGNWIQHSKVYEPETKRWYCSMCHKRTPIEINPEWNADGRPHCWEDDKDYEWFARCAYCHNEHYHSSYECPNCGAPIPGEAIEYGKQHLNPYYSYEFGVTGYDWEERHQCPKCRHKYWIMNSTC